MANQESPKDYSSMYCEDSSRLPIASVRRAIPAPNLGHCTTNNPSSPNNQCSATMAGSAVNQRSRPKPQPYSDSRDKQIDGERWSQKRLPESTVDLRVVAARLTDLLQDNHHIYAMETLNNHYSSVFNQRRRVEVPKPRSEFKAYIQYYDEKDTYVVRVDRNTLKAVIDKLPKRGDYRYFFKQPDNTCEEIEAYDSLVPYHEKNEFKQIYCQVFPL